MFPIFSPTCLLFQRTMKHCIFDTGCLFVSLKIEMKIQALFWKPTVLPNIFENLSYYWNQWIMIRASCFLKIFPNFMEEEVDWFVIYFETILNSGGSGIASYLMFLFNSHVTVCGNTNKYFLHNTRCAWKIKIEKGPPSQLIHVIVVRNYTEDRVR